MLDTEPPGVRALPLFSNMNDLHFDAMMRRARVEEFPQHSKVIVEGDDSEFLHVLFSGSVELFAGWDGRETSMTIIRPVSIFILAATIRDAPYLMSARTLEKSRILLVPSADVREVFEVDSTFARAVVDELAQCYRGVVKGMKNLKLRNSVERLANYLLRQQKNADGAEQFDLHIEKRKLALQLGMTPENLSRALKNLQPHGVKIDGPSVTIADRAALVRYAKPSPLIDDPRV